MVLGGTDLMRARHDMGTVLGVFIIGIISNGLTSSTWLHSIRWLLRGALSSLRYGSTSMGVEGTLSVRKKEPLAAGER